MLKEVMRGMLAEAQADFAAKAATAESPLVSPQQRVLEDVIRNAPPGPSHSDVPALRTYSAKNYKKLIAAPCEARRTPADDLLRSAGVRGEWFVWPGVDDKPAAPTILYLHGGGYVYLSVDVYAGYLSQLTRVSGRRVLGIDYRLLPEHAMEDAVADAISAIKFLVDVKGVPPGHIVVVGDSAGGGLTLLTVQHIIRHAVLRAPLAAIGLISPYTDVSSSGASVRSNTDPQFGNRPVEEGRHAVRNVTRGGQYKPTDPRISPLFGSFANFPPARFVVSAGEMLLDDTLRAAEKARQAGGVVEVEVSPGSLHDLPLFYRLPEGIEATARMAYWLNKYLPPIALQARL
jgi:acetyl esterase/lipase